MLVFPRRDELPVLLAVAFIGCVYGAEAVRRSSHCPCLDPSLCQLIRAPPRQELFVFRAGNTSDWKRYDWSKITTVAVFGQYQPDLMCYAHSKGARFVLTAGYPVAKLANATSRAAWVKEQVNTALNQHMDGINIDFEAELAESEAHYLVALVNETAAAFKRYNPYAQISFDTPYAPGCTWGRCYDYKNLSQSCDFLVLMNYDLSASGIAVANDPFMRLQIGVESFQADGIPAHKLVTAFPWYGYDYECTHMLQDSICSGIGYQLDGQPRSQRSYMYITQMLRNLSVVGILNETYVSKFFNYQDKDTGKYHQVWYDDPETLGARYQYAKANHLRGVSMWQADLLDYSDDPEAEKLTKAMWDAIDQFMT